MILVWHLWVWRNIFRDFCLRFFFFTFLAPTWAQGMLICVWSFFPSFFYGMIIFKVKVWKGWIKIHSLIAMCNKLLIESAAASQNIIIQMLHRVAKVVARFENCECQCFIILQFTTGCLYLKILCTGHRAATFEAEKSLLILVPCSFKKVV